jgi:hypothetical protein
MSTWGTSGQPNSMTMNFDALFSTSLANHKKRLNDQISNSNAFFHALKAQGAWEGEDGGEYLTEQLMYQTTPVDFFSGYDELPLTPTEGITQAQYPWRMMASPVSISYEEERKNAQRIISLVEAKLTQLEISMQEAFPKAFLRGQFFNQSSGNLHEPAVSPVNGAYGFDPLPLLVKYDPTTVHSIGGIPQASYSWWQNRYKVSAATTTGAFIDEIMHLYNSCAFGPMGPPNLGLCDQITWELLHKAYRAYYQNNAKENGDMPFQNLKFWNCTIVMDEFVPNVFANTIDTTTTTGGTLYLLNTKAFKCKYDTATNFIESEWKKPVNQAARYKHILFMGNVTMNNRRKHGVIGKIARTLT